MLALAALSGCRPRFTHRVDSLELVQDLIAAGRGVALLPAGFPRHDGVRMLELHDPIAELRTYAVARRGREAWAPLALISRLLQAAIGGAFGECPMAGGVRQAAASGP